IDQFHVRHPLNQGREGNLRFELGEHCSDTEVCPMTKGKWLSLITSNIEALRIAELIWVVIRRPQEHDHALAVRDLSTIPHEVLGRSTPSKLHRTVVACTFAHC